MPLAQMNTDDIGWMARPFELCGLAAAETALVACAELAAGLRAGFLRARSWPAPPNWSVADWQDELRAVALGAACQAQGDYDPRREIPLRAFVYLRVAARALTRYRQEWSFALHCTACAVDVRTLDAAGAERADFCANCEALRAALARIPAADRWLVEQLFWHGRTEAVLAKRLAISQQAVSKRKRAVLLSLRALIRAAEKITSAGCRKD